MLEFLVLDLRILIAFLSIGERGTEELGLLGLTFLLISFFLMLGDGELEEIALVLVSEVGDEFLLEVGVRLLFVLFMIVVLESESLIISIDLLEEVLVFVGDWEIGVGSSASGDRGICWGG